MFKTKTTFPAGKVVDESLYFFRNSEPDLELRNLTNNYSDSTLLMKQVCQKMAHSPLVGSLMIEQAPPL